MRRLLIGPTHGLDTSDPVNGPIKLKLDFSFRFSFPNILNNKVWGEYSFKEISTLIII